MEITFRKLDPYSDVDYLMEWYSDEKVSKFCSWDAFTSKEAAIQHVVDTVIPHPWHRAICLSNDRCRAELGYVVASAYWGKGIATLAVKMAAKAIFLEWQHLERLQAVVDVENPASQRVLEKVGFKKEGILRKNYLLKGKPRDAIMFSILSTHLQISCSSEK